MGHGWRRPFFMVLVTASTVAGTALMAYVLGANGYTWDKIGILALFTINFGWICNSFWTGIAGVLVRAFGGDPAAPDAPDTPLVQRTAIVMPVYNEDPERVFAGLEATWRSVEGTGQGQAFELFVLSDTTRPEIARREEACFAALKARLGPSVGLWYRRRAKNLHRKAGNIAEFCERWGARYENMMVLDADSVMEGATIVRLARLMQANPRAGIVQTVPIPVNRDTAFARYIQFASRLYGPVLAAGMAWWHRSEANYWGHNAIIRIAPFTEHCGLPILPGKPPLGGEILSHDFVEAALMRRAGWQVWMVPELTGSFEEVPPNIIDYAKRDRRWTQGNLQHLKLLRMRGLHWLSRLHLILGVGGYVTSPLWLLMLMLSTAQAISLALTGIEYFQPGLNLFPTWPVSRTTEVWALLVVTLGLLMLPKLLILLLALATRSWRRSFGGGGALLLSVLAEQVFSVLLAPTMMLFHTIFVLSTAAGLGVSWEAQERGERGIGFGEAWARQGWHCVAGIAWAIALWVWAPSFFWWMLPVTTGLVLAPLLTMVTSRLGFGQALKRAGIFLTPAEVERPGSLVALDQALATPAADALVPGATPGSTTPPEDAPRHMGHTDLIRWSPFRRDTANPLPRLGGG